MNTTIDFKRITKYLVPAIVPCLEHMILKNLLNP